MQLAPGAAWRRRSERLGGKATVLPRMSAAEPGRLYLQLCQTLSTFGNTTEYVTMFTAYVLLLRTIVEV